MSMEARKYLEPGSREEAAVESVERAVNGILQVVGREVEPPLILAALMRLIKYGLAVGVAEGHISEAEAKAWIVAWADVPFVAVMDKPTETVN